MFGLPCQYRRNQHRIIHPRLEGWLKRQTTDTKLRRLLFFYYHLQTGNFVIGMWLVPCRSFVDVLNLGPSLNVTEERAIQIREQIKSPVGRDDFVKSLRKQEHEYLYGLQEQNDAEVERREWKQNKTKKVMIRV